MGVVAIVRVLYFHIYSICKMVVGKKFFVASDSADSAEEGKIYLSY